MYSLSWSLVLCNDVTIDPCNGRNITAYLVEWAQEDTFNETLEFELVSPLTSQFIITGLTTGQLYYSRISAVNFHGPGLTRPSTPPYSSPTAPPHPPEWVNLTHHSATSVNVSFSAVPCDHPQTDPCNGADVVEYEVQWSTKSNFPIVETFNTTVLPEESTISVTIEDLITDQVYFFRVRGKNSMGWSQIFSFPDPAHIIPISVASPPRHVSLSVHSPTSLFVTFSLPNMTEYGGSMPSYALIEATPGEFGTEDSVVKQIDRLEWAPFVIAHQADFEIGENTSLTFWHDIVGGSVVDVCSSAFGSRSLLLHEHGIREVRTKWLNLVGGAEIEFYVRFAQDVSQLWLNGGSLLYPECHDMLGIGSFESEVVGSSAWQNATVNVQYSVDGISWNTVQTLDPTEYPLFSRYNRIIFDPNDISNNYFCICVLLFCELTDLPLVSFSILSCNCCQISIILLLLLLCFFFALNVWWLTYRIRLILPQDALTSNTQLRWYQNSALSNPSQPVRPWLLDSIRVVRHSSISHVVSQLITGTAYKIRVSLVNSAGTSLSQNASPIKAIPAGLPLPPNWVSLQIQNSTSLIVSFPPVVCAAPNVDPCNGRNVTKYIVNVCTHSDCSTPYANLDVALEDLIEDIEEGFHESSFVFSIKVQKLNSATPYYAFVQAMNAQGWGDLRPSNPEYVFLADPPDPVESATLVLVSATELRY